MPAFWLSRLSSSSTRLEFCCGDCCPHCNLQVCRRSRHLHETLGHRLMNGGGDAAAAPTWTWQLLLLLLLHGGGGLKEKVVMTVLPLCIVSKVIQYAPWGLRQTLTWGNVMRSHLSCAFFRIVSKFI